jgi:hypothetical protein
VPSNRLGRIKQLLCALLLRSPTFGGSKQMADEHLNFDAAITFLRQVYTLEGADAAVQAAKDMISADAAWIAQEHGPDEAHRVLQIVEAAQGQGLP